MSEDLHTTSRPVLMHWRPIDFGDVRWRVKRMLDPPGVYTSKWTRAMITVQAARGSTTIEKIAARNENRSVRRLWVTAGATGIEISARGPLGIIRPLPAK